MWDIFDRRHNVLMTERLKVHEEINVYLCMKREADASLKKVSKQTLSSYILQRESRTEIIRFSVFEWVACKYPQCLVCICKCDYCAQL